MYPAADWNPPLVLDPTATAKAVGISKALLYKLWRKGEGPPFIRLGNDRRVLVDDLRNWLESLKEAA